MAVTLHYFTEFGKRALQKTICGGIYAKVLYFLVRVQCRRKESSRSLSHLLMSFLYIILQTVIIAQCFLLEWRSKSVGRLISNMQVLYCNISAVIIITIFLLWTDAHGDAHSRSISTIHGRDTERLQQLSVADNQSTNSSHYRHQLSVRYTRQARYGLLMLCSLYFFGSTYNYC